MDKDTNKIIVRLELRRKPEWTAQSESKQTNRRLHSKHLLLAAACFCCAAASYWAVRHPEHAELAMSHISGGFEYDETIGRLQFVSNMLPNSVEVFLNTDSIPVHIPTDAPIIHPWSEEEPWFEYACTGAVRACSAGNVLAVIKDRWNEHTVRIMHTDGSESLYSGLNTVAVQEMDAVDIGTEIGTAQDFAAFEYRKNGLSVLPVFR